MSTLKIELTCETNREPLKVGDFVLYHDEVWEVKSLPKYNSQNFWVIELSRNCSGVYAVITECTPIKITNNWRAALLS